MSYRFAEALGVLRAELNARCPNRDIASDGALGDTAHAGKGSGSDHNPWLLDSNGVGVVRARDFDEDLDGLTADSGDDARWFAEHIRALGKKGDQRLTGGGYVIYSAQIAGGSYGWEWRSYSGTNAHEKHVHVSLSRNQSGYDSTAPWGIYPSTQPTPKDWFDMATEAELRKIVSEELDKRVNPDGKGNLLVRIRDSVAKTEARSSEIVIGIRNLLKRP